VTRRSRLRRTFRRPLEARYANGEINMPVNDLTAVDPTTAAGQAALWDSFLAIPAIFSGQGGLFTSTASGGSHGLTVRFGTSVVVDDVSFAIAPGEKFALVGESGSGKSITALSVMRLVDAAVTTGGIRFEGEDLLKKSERQMRGLRGGGVDHALDDSGELDQTQLVSEPEGAVLGAQERG